MNIKTLQSAGQVKTIVIDENKSGQRIDNFLTTLCKGVPKSRLYRALRKGEVRVNKKRIKPEYRLQIDDSVRIPPLRVSAPKPKPTLSDRDRNDIENTIIYEDNHLIMINKPAGMAVHGGSGIRLGVIEALRLARPKSKFLELVHRIDRQTSGCLLIAKKSSILKVLHEQLREKAIDKRYLALVHGKVDFKKKTIDVPLSSGHLSNGERFVRPSKDGKSAITKLSVIRTLNNMSLLSVNILTGRTHQIRVHLQGIGHPVVGDDKYGDRELDKSAFKSIPKRMYLHAASLKVERPEGLLAICACLDSKFRTI